MTQLSDLPIEGQVEDSAFHAFSSKFYLAAGGYLHVWW